MCNVAHDNVHVLYMEYHRCLLCTCVTCVMQHYMECQRCLLHTRMSVMQTGCSSQGRQSADWTLDSPLTPKSNSLSCTCTQVSSVYVYLCNVACTVICYIVHTCTQKTSVVYSIQGCIDLDSIKGRISFTNVLQHIHHPTH